METIIKIIEDPFQFFNLAILISIVAGSIWWKIKDIKDFRWCLKNYAKQISKTGTNPCFDGKSLKEIEKILWRRVRKTGRYN